MASTFLKGKEVVEIELMDIFPAEEGMITQYYGRIGGGKTYAATSDILELLRRGKVVYANWRIHYDGTDERRSKAYALASIIFPWRKRFFDFPKENLKYFELSDKWAQNNGFEDFTHWLSTRTDCSIFADEGHIMFDSYAGIRMSIEKRAAVYHTRHFNRSINIISQRPTAIHVSMRSNVAIFYRCQQIWNWGGIRRFKRTEFQDIAQETVDEQEEKIIGVKYYWGKKRVFEAYDTKYLRGEILQSDKVLFKAYDFNYIARWALLMRNLFGKDSRKIQEVKPVLVPKPPTKALVDYIPRIDKYVAAKGASVLE